MSIADLRSCLETISNNDNIEEHLSAIESLKSEHCHNIQLVEQADSATPRNCYEYAFSMDWELTHWVGSLSLTELYVGPSFVAKYLLPLLIEIPQSMAQDGDLVLYFDSDTLTHAGTVMGTRVISKWGKGHAYQHNLDEVPASYGARSKFYSKIQDGVATRKFVEYVRSHPDYATFAEVFEEKFGNINSPN